MVTEKSEGTTTIEVSVETAKKLHSLKDKLAKILRKRNVSFDTLFKLFFAVQPLDVVLQDLILAEMPSVTFKATKRIPQKVDINFGKETENNE